MFKALRKLAENSKKLKSKVLFQIVFQNSEVQNLIIDLNRFEQLFKESELSTGEEISGEYSYLTGLITSETNAVFTYQNNEGESFSRQKKQGEPYFLLDSGEFYKSFRVKLFDDGFTIQADTIKDDGTDLLKYGKILGLTNESKAKIITKILPTVIQETRKAIAG